MRRRLPAALALSVVGALLGAGAAWAAPQTYVVTGFDDPAPTPACTNNFCPSLRAAVEAANANPNTGEDIDSIVLRDAGTYDLSRGELDIDDQAAIVMRAGKRYLARPRR